jgi:DnaJ-class molecular chaperone
MKAIVKDCKKNPDHYEGCTLCFGHGVITAWDDMDEFKCPRCDGAGIVLKKCPVCRGDKGYYKDMSDEWVDCIVCKGKGTM